jgi:hypothetical protein
MHLLSRLAFFALVSVTLVSCDTAGSAGTLLGSTASMLGRTLGSVARLGGGSASVKNEDTSSEAIAARGKIIEERGDKVGPGGPEGSTVAQR